MSNPERPRHRRRRRHVSAPSISGIQGDSGTADSDTGRCPRLVVLPSPRTPRRVLNQLSRAANENVLNVDCSCVSIASSQLNCVVIDRSDCVDINRQSSVADKRFLHDKRVFADDQRLATDVKRCSSSEDKACQTAASTVRRLKLVKSQKRRIIQVLCVVGWILCCPCWTIGFSLRDHPYDYSERHHDNDHHPHHHHQRQPQQQQQQGSCSDDENADPCWPCDEFVWGR